MQTCIAVFAILGRIDEMQKEFTDFLVPIPDANLSQMLCLDPGQWSDHSKGLCMAVMTKLRFQFPILVEVDWKTDGYVGSNPEFAFQFESAAKEFC